ncbi:MULTISPECIES: hypothetical protein, partial [unclassified Sphingomonas]|uniref:hypothetical protein n=1 Tax=unclassified Sphingomonas TaxID=196159 RepID=UPI001E4ECF24
AFTASFLIAWFVKYVIAFGLGILGTVSAFHCPWAVEGRTTRTNRRCRACRNPGGSVRGVRVLSAEL